MATSQLIPETLLIQKKNDIVNSYKSYSEPQFGHLTNWKFCLSGIRNCIDNMESKWTSDGGISAISELRSLVDEIESTFNVINEYVNLNIDSEIVWHENMTKNTFKI